MDRCAMWEWRLALQNPAEQNLVHLDEVLAFDLAGEVSPLMAAIAKPPLTGLKKASTAR